MLEIDGKEVRVAGSLIRVAYMDGEGYQFLTDPKAAPEMLRSLKKRIDLFTFIPRLSNPSVKYDFPIEMDNIAAVPVSTYDHWMSKQIDFKVRNKVRKSAKNGVEVREVPLDDELLRGIQNVYNETPIRQGRKFWHYGKDIEALRKMKLTFKERSIFIGAYFEGNLIGFIKLVTDETNTQAGLMHILSMIKHRDKAPTNALMAQAVRSCAERGVSFLWYANMSYGNKQESALADFKRHNGFEKIDIPRYYIPLTAAGRLGFRFGWHRGILDWLPESVAETYRKVRLSYYRSKYRDFPVG